MSIKQTVVQLFPQWQGSLHLIIGLPMCFPDEVRHHPALGETLCSCALHNELLGLQARARKLADDKIALVELRLELANTIARELATPRLLTRFLDEHNLMLELRYELRQREQRIERMRMDILRLQQHCDHLVQMHDELRAYCL